MNVKKFLFTDIQQLSQYVGQKAWWDSVDSWQSVFGKYVQLHSSEKERVFQLFYQHEDFWMRRLSILLQLKEKETLNQQLLMSAILYDQFTDEFFIQKAIEWSLR